MSVTTLIMKSLFDIFFKSRSVAMCGETEMFLSICHFPLTALIYHTNTNSSVKCLANAETVDLFIIL